MEFNNKKLEKTSKLINIIISTVLCIFLIMLSSKVIGDVDNWEDYPNIEEFQDNVAMHKNDSLIQIIVKEDAKINNKLATVNMALTNAESIYTTTKQSFDTWLSARGSNSSSKDNEVIKRANELDEVGAVVNDWKEKANSLEMELNKNRIRTQKFQQANSEEYMKAYVLLEESIKAYQLKVFLKRLVIVVPILLLGLFFLFKFRKHKYWPLFFGFVLFSFYSFFIGLVPYLPSYGGYIRYTVGIIICIVLGVIAINKIRAFIQRKKEELKVSTKERSKNVQIATAEKALEKNMCPSCGKDFIVIGWDKTSKAKVKPVKSVLITNYCRFCGLQLFKKCEKCDTDNFAHLPFCSNCGDPITVD